MKLVLPLLFACLSSSIAAEIHWASAQSPILLTNDFEVPPGDTLVVEAGVVVQGINSQRYIVPFANSTVRIRATLFCMNEPEQTYPEKHWHCYVHLRGHQQDDYVVVNDMTFNQVSQNVVLPWLSGKSFPLAGTIVNSRDEVDKIQIAQTPQTQAFYANDHDILMRQRKINDMVLA